MFIFILCLLHSSYTYFNPNILNNVILDISMEPIDYVIPHKNGFTDYLYYTSYFIGLSSLVSYYHGDYTTFLFMFFLFLTSINYWKNPSYGIRRNVDLFLVKMINVYFYGTTLVYSDEFCHQVFVNCLYHVLFLYFIEHLYVYANHKHWVVLHMMIHVYLSFFTPVVLYLL